MDINNLLKNKFGILDQSDGFDLFLSIKINVLKIKYITLKIKKINYFKIIFKVIN